jgi:hypothetical protein
MERRIEKDTDSIIILNQTENNQNEIKTKATN